MFLAFPRGQAEDLGCFPEAARHYSEAARLDPGFSQARERAETASSEAAAERLSLSSTAQLSDPALATMAFIAELLNEVMGSGLRCVPAGIPPPTSRDPLGEIGGKDRLGVEVEVIVVMKRP